MYQAQQNGSRHACQRLNIQRLCMQPLQRQSVHYCHADKRHEQELDTRNTQNGQQQKEESLMKLADRQCNPG